jgi:hypothetical protein
LEARPKEGQILSDQRRLNDRSIISVLNIDAEQRGRRKVQQKPISEPSSCGTNQVTEHGCRLNLYPSGVGEVHDEAIRFIEVDYPDAQECAA